MTKFTIRMLCISLLIFMAAEPGFAKDWIGSVSYQVSIPSGDTEQFINDYSFRGLSLDFRQFIHRNTSLGFTAGWNVFHERTSDTIYLNTKHPGAITGLQDRVVNAFPIMINVHQYFGNRRDIQPYIGLNAGGFIMTQQFDIGIHSIQENEWQWGMAPEVGVLIPLQGYGSLLLSGKYHYAFTGESITGRDINHEYWSIGIGYAWREY